MGNKKSTELLSSADEDSAYTTTESEISSNSDSSLEDGGDETLILSQYAIKKKGIQNEIASLEKRIENRNQNINHFKNELNAQKKSLVSFQADIIEIQKKIQVHKDELMLERYENNLNEAKKRLKKIISPGSLSQLWYRLKRSMMNTFGYDTNQQRIEKSILFYQTQLQAAQKKLAEFENQHATSLNELQKEAQLTETKIKTLQTNIQHSSLEIMSEKLSQLKQQLSMLNEEPLQKELLQGCKIKFKAGIKYDPESIDSKAVKISLRNFIKFPTISNLEQLKQTMINHPDFRINHKLNLLIDEARKLYPQITTTSEPRLSIRAEKAQEIVSQKLENLSMQIQHLQQQFSTLEESVNENKLRLQQQKNQIQQNKNALILCYRLLFIAEQRKKVAAHHHNKQENAAVEKIIYFLNQKIQVISPFVPYASPMTFKNLREVAVLDYETSRAVIEEILADYGLLLPEEEFLNFATLQHLIQQSPDSTLILEKINQIPQIQQQINVGSQEIMRLIDELENTVTELVELEKYNEKKQENALEAMDNITTAFNQLTRTVHNPAEEKIISHAMVQYSQMVERFSIKYHEHHKPEKALKKFIQHLDELPPFVKVKLDAALQENRPIIQAALTTPLNRLETQLNTISNLDLTAKNFYSFQKNCHRQEKRLNHLASNILQLQRHHQSLAQDQTQIIAGEKFHDATQEITALIKKCKKKPVFSKDSPVRIKLKDFLSDPTPFRLQILFTAMHDEHQNYIKNKNVVSLIVQSGKFYTDIAKEHQKILDSQTSHSLQEFKQIVCKKPKSAPTTLESQDNCFNDPHFPE